MQWNSQCTQAMISPVLHGHHLRLVSFMLDFMVKGFLPDGPPSLVKLVDLQAVITAIGCVVSTWHLLHRWSWSAHGRLSQDQVCKQMTKRVHATYPSRLCHWIKCKKDACRGILFSSSCSTMLEPVTGVRPMAASNCLIVPQRAGGAQGVIWFMVAYRLFRNPVKCMHVYERIL